MHLSLLGALNDISWAVLCVIVLLVVLRNKKQGKWYINTSQMGHAGLKPEVIQYIFSVWLSKTILSD